MLGRGRMLDSREEIQFSAIDSSSGIRVLTLIAYTCFGTGWEIL